MIKMTNFMLHEFYLNKEKKKKGQGNRRMSETVQAVKKNVCLAQKIHKLKNKLILKTKPKTQFLDQIP